MFILITMELKRRLKKPMTWFLILILTLMSLINIMETKEARSYRYFKGHDAYLFEGDNFDWAQFYDEEDRQRIPKAVYSLETYTETIRAIPAANNSGDVKEVTRLYAFYFFLSSKAALVRNDTIGNPEFDNLVKPFWYDVSGGIPYDDINFYPEGQVFRRGWANFLIGRYYHQLYMNDFEPIYKDDLNYMTYLYDYFFNIVPLFIFILSILLVYNSVNKEKNSGSLKLVITQSISRWKYYISKWLAGTVHVLFTLLLPPLVIGTILGIRHDFVSPTYPTIYFKNSMTSLKTIPNLFDSFDFAPRFSTTFSHVAPGNTSLFWSPHERMELIPFYQYLLLVLLLTVIFVAFAVALTQLISALINKEIISFVTIGGIFIAGTLLSTPFTQGKSLNLSPFTMGNPGRIIIGTYNITALGATIILLASTALLLAIGCRYFRTKEI